MQNMDKGRADTRTVCTRPAVQQVFGRGRMQDDEGEFAARGEQQRGLDRRRCH